MIAGEHLHDDERVDLVVLRDDVDRAIGAHRERRAQLLRGVVGADRHDDDLAARGARVRLAVLEQAQRGLDRVLVERVDDPGRAGQVDVAVLDLGLLRRVGDPLHGNEDLHADSFLLRDRSSTSATTQSAARTISNFFGRVPGDAAVIGVRASTHASASSSSMPKIMRAAMCGGIDRVELARVLRGRDDAAEHAQEVGELGVVVLLHELAALAQLDREDLGGGRLVVHELQVRPDERAQLLARRLAGDRGLERAVELLHAALEQRDQQVVLALEVEVDRAVGDAGFLRDVGDLRGEEAVAREDPLGGVEDALALVAASPSVAPLNEPSFSRLIPPVTRLVKRRRRLKRCSACSTTCGCQRRIGSSLCSARRS